MVDKKINFGLIGVGYLGKFHLTHLKNIKNVSMIGVYDADKKHSSQISKDYGVQNYKTLDDLLCNVDAVSIVTPTNTHMDIALKALAYNCHIFIEKPISNTMRSVKNFLGQIKTKNKVIHVGHIERFNPAFNSFMQNSHAPLFLECHRLTKINNRSMDVSVILDLMIHDIDLVLNLVDSPINNIIADGICVVSDKVDLANVKLIFKNGCVANLTASRISNKDMRKIRVFEHQVYTNIDLLNKSLNQYSAKYDKKREKFRFNNQKIAVKQYDALKMELTYFCNAIIKKDTNLNNVSKAVQALEVSEKINTIINNKLK